MEGLPSVLRGHTKWVTDHEVSTVGDGVGQSNDSFTYNKQNEPRLFLVLDTEAWVFLYLKKRLDKAFEIVYTNSVVNREVIRNVVTRRKREIDTLDLWEVY